MGEDTFKSMSGKELRVSKFGLGIAADGTSNTYTQTYNTADRTIAALTSPGAGGGSGATATTFSGAECDALRADVLAILKYVTAIIDDLQLKGFVS